MTKKLSQEMDTLMFALRLQGASYEAIAKVLSKEFGTEVSREIVRKALRGTGY